MRLPAVTLSLGGKRFRYVAEDGARLGVAEAYARFRVADDAPADCEIRCRVAEASPRPEPVVFDSGGTWELRHAGAGVEEVCFYTATGRGGREPLAVLTWDLARRRAGLRRAPQYTADGVIPVGYPVDEYLAARALARDGGLVLHASALADAGGAYVFTGHSGAGKSTIAGLAESLGAQVLSDDRTILACDGHRAVAWGTPWHGSYRRGSPACAPVRAIFLLCRAAQDDVRPIGAARLFKEMLVRLVQPTVDRGELRAAVETAERIAAVVRGAELHFRPTRDAYVLARRFGTP
jgi:hypothetical protein